MGKHLRALILALMAVTPAIAQQFPSFSDFMEANTRFALKFFRKAAANSPERNVLSAPIALSLEFAFLQNGGDQETRREIGEVFELQDMSPQAINIEALALRHSLKQSYAPPPKLSSGLAPAFRPLIEQLTIAASLWSRAGVGYREAFLNADRKYYGYTTATLPEN